MLNFNYQGTVLGPDLDVSSMEKLHIDIWTPDCTSFEVSLIYKLLAGGQDERKVTLTPTLNGWNSFDIPLSDYSSQAATVNLTQVFQLKFETTGWPPTKTVYYDNIYFYKEGTLPISLIDFNVKPSVNGVTVNWKTANEKNIKALQ